MFSVNLYLQYIIHITYNIKHSFANARTCPIGEICFRSVKYLMHYAFKAYNLVHIICLETNKKLCLQDLVL